MQKLTQTRPDNCWQTCVAMLLGCAPEALPAQQDFPGDRQRYADALRAFLHKHHDVTYVEVEKAAFSKVLRPGLRHVMIGETERTSPDHDFHHAIVGIEGKPFWDVFPSRAGLTEVVKWGLLVPIPEDWRAVRATCACPACLLDAEEVAHVG